MHILRGNWSLALLAFALSASCGEEKGENKDRVSVKKSAAESYAGWEKVARSIGDAVALASSGKPVPAGVPYICGNPVEDTHDVFSVSLLPGGPVRMVQTVSSFEVGHTLAIGDERVAHLFDLTTTIGAPGTPMVFDFLAYNEPKNTLRLATVPEALAVARALYDDAHEPGCPATKFITTDPKANATTLKVPPFVASNNVRAATCKDPTDFFAKHALDKDHELRLTREITWDIVVTDGTDYAGIKATIPLEWTTKGEAAKPCLKITGSWSISKE